MDLQKIKLFSDLEPEKLELIKRMVRKRVYPKGTTVFVTGQQADGLYIIYAGQVKVSIFHHDGREKTLAILGAGEILGEVTLYGNKLRSANAETVEVTTFLIITHDNFHALLKALPGLSSKVIELLSERLRQASRQIEELTFLDARRRVICSIIHLANEKGINVGNEILITPSLTHVELAKMAGVTRETVTKVLNELQNEKLIGTSKRIIRVPNPTALNEQLF